MDKDTTVERLKAAGLLISREARTGNDDGWQLRLQSGAIVNCFDSGRVNVQGRNQDAARSALALDEPAPATSLSRSVGSRKVFVIYGHDPAARTQLEAMLRRWQLDPLIMDQLPSGGQTIIEKLENLRREANFAIVLATPDDEGHKKDRPTEKLFRARQNVVLELGMMLAHLGRAKVAILIKGEVSMERPSDIQGLLYMPFKDDVEETRIALAKELSGQGLKIDVDRL
jgi:predicted nucleotide-binding protein